MSNYRLDTRAILNDPGLGSGSYHVKVLDCIKVRLIVFVRYNH